MKAVRILPGNEWNLDHQLCSEIFLHDDVIDCPVAIYSINGSSRQGKSFLLNLMIHRLKQKSQWKETQVENVFHWRGGTDACTTGVFITDKPIFIESVDHGKVAVFFMDAEGFHDVKNNNNNFNHKIFSLCSTISKSQMYNIQELISDESLDEITTFRTMFDIAVREESLKIHKADLLFLVRDFDDVSFGRGIEGGEQYLSERMERYSQSSLTVWKGNTKCFLFSYPGRKIDDGAKCDIMKDTDPDFLTEVESLVHFLFQQSFGPIVIDGRPVMGRNMPDLLLDLDNCLCQNEQAYVSGLQSMIEKLLEEFAEECLKIYNNCMVECEEQEDETENNGASSKLKQLPTYHKKAQSKALQHVTEKWSYQSNLEDCKTTVICEIAKSYQEKEDGMATQFCKDAVEEWRNKMKESIKFSCDEMRTEYKSFGYEVLLRLHQLVVNDVTRSKVIFHFKRDFKDACNEELDRLYDNKKILKIVGTALAGAAVAAPFVAIPPLTGAAIAAAAPTALILTGGAAALGTGGAGLTAAGTAAITTMFGERIYVKELDVIPYDVSRL